MNEKKERLQKVIARSGITSRRKAEQYILDGRVKVNNKTVTELGTKVSSADEVQVDNIPIDKEQKVYYVLYKPRGYISAVSDDRGRKTVIDLMENVQERVFPIGRLDYNSTGVLLLTNDGEFANMLMHPKFEVKKEYVIKVKGIPTKKILDKMRTGIHDKGDILKAVHYNIRSTDVKKQTAILDITLLEGKNRHIRRMMDQLGYPVLKLSREKYGFISLAQLQPGKYRELTRKEIHDFKQIAKKQ